MKRGMYGLLSAIPSTIRVSVKQIMNENVKVVNRNGVYAMMTMWGEKTEERMSLDPRKALRICIACIVSAAKLLRRYKRRHAESLDDRCRRRRWTESEWKWGVKMLNSAEANAQLSENRPTTLCSASARQMLQLRQSQSRPFIIEPWIQNKT